MTLNSRLHELWNVVLISGSLKAHRTTIGPLAKQPKDLRYARPWYGHATHVWYAPDWHDWTTGASTQGKVCSSLIEHLNPVTAVGFSSTLSTEKAEMKRSMRCPCSSCSFTIALA